MSTSAHTYVVATTKPWNVAAFARHAPGLPGRWELIDQPDVLTLARVQALNPRYIFFPHWSWPVPAEICAAVECVCFHMTDVPYGRGGSPLQNLIACGHRDTMLSALRMTAELDAGPVYLKRPLSLAGRAQEIYQRTAELCYAMITEIVTREPLPQPQTGEVVRFARRTPAESVLPAQATLAQLHDHIRMLDADTYPPAFLDYGDYRLEFHHARAADDCIEAQVTIRRRVRDAGSDTP